MKKANIRQRLLACTRPPDTSSKLTRATVLAFSAYLVLYLPGLVISCIFMVQNFNGFYMSIVTDISILMYFVNNLVNPFIYYFTLQDFKKGFSSFLRCAQFSKQDKKLSDYRLAY